MGLEVSSWIYYWWPSVGLQVYDIMNIHDCVCNIHVAVFS